MASIAGLPSPQGTTTVTGTVAVSNFPASVEVSNDVGNPLPVSGTVAVSNFPATQPVSGTVSVGNFPANQNVTVSNVIMVTPSGTFNVAIVGTVPVTGTVTLTGMATPTTSLSAQSTVQNGAVLDDGGMRPHHTIVIITSAGVSAGTVVLQVSQDNVNWFPAVTVSTTSASTLYSADVVGAFRYSRAAITQAITGGTITATVASV